ncbi:MAG: hypothetical protein IPN42_05705 [Methylococcaceae bacterium]|nr:hypothetical protein [Methylococcaceae bacterium]
MKSEAAQVANLIKTELKKNGINCRVKSSNYAGGIPFVSMSQMNSPAVLIKLQRFVANSNKALLMG